MLIVFDFFTFKQNILNGYAVFQDIVITQARSNKMQKKLKKSLMGARSKKRKRKKID